MNLEQLKQKQAKIKRQPLTHVDEDWVIPFGKYEGKSLKQLMKINPGYLVWLDNNLTGIKIDPTIVDKAVNIEFENIITRSLRRCYPNNSY